MQKSCKYWEKHFQSVTSNLHLVFVVLLLDLYPTGAAVAWTSGHFNLTCTLVNLQVVLTEPGISQYHILVAQTGYGKVSVFWVVLVVENNIHHFMDGSCFVGGTINIVHRDGTSEGSGSKPVLPYIVPVKEESISSAIK